MMSRADLLALSPDDLAALTNRGTLKRAQRELAGGELNAEITEDEEQLVVSWSDGVVCTFPAGETIHQAQCSSGSLGISRHIVRSVLAYQQHARTGGTDVSAEQAEESSESETDQAAVWNPGDITDEQLEQQFRKAAMSRTRKLFGKGVLVELTRGAKPVARFLHESCTIRFPVPGDVRYATGDCSESTLPQWVMLAVWSFRELPADKPAGLLSLQQAKLTTPTDELAVLDQLLLELATDGLAGLSPTWPQKLSRLEKKIRAAGLIWPAELVLDLLVQYERYQSHDARFEPNELVRLTGELIARGRAIRSQNGSVPQPLIRGTKSDRATDIRKGRFVGVGMRVKQGRQHVTINAYWQNVDSGGLVAIERTFNDPAPEAKEVPGSFTDLSTHGLVRGVSLGTAALSQILLGSGRRTPTNELIIPRGAGKLTVNPQTFQWEHLKPPFAVENFAQLRHRMEPLPPDWLRPLRRTENLHSIMVSSVTDVYFDEVSQQVTATIHDVVGNTATLVHPFHSRGQDAFNNLTSTLENRGCQVKFVCGHVQIARQRICIMPISVVLEDHDSRIAINPWITSQAAESTGAVFQQVNSTTEPVDSCLADFMDQFQTQLANAMVTGVNQAVAAEWQQLVAMARHVGFNQIANEIQELAKALSDRSGQVKWDSTFAARQMGQLLMICRILD